MFFFCKVHVSVLRKRFYEVCRDKNRCFILDCVKFDADNDPLIWDELHVFLSEKEIDHICLSGFPNEANSWFYWDEYEDKWTPTCVAGFQFGSGTPATPCDGKHSHVHF